MIDPSKLVDYLSFEMELLDVKLTDLQTKPYKNQMEDDLLLMYTVQQIQIKFVLDRVKIGQFDATD
jgi:hypothetical protein